MDHAGRRGGVHERLEELAVVDRVDPPKATVQVSLVAFGIPFTVKAP